MNNNHPLTPNNSLNSSAKMTLKLKHKLRESERTNNLRIKRQRSLIRRSKPRRLRQTKLLGLMRLSVSMKLSKPMIPAKLARSRVSHIQKVQTVPQTKPSATNLTQQPPRLTGSMRPSELMLHPRLQPLRVHSLAKMNKVNGTLPLSNNRL